MRKYPITIITPIYNRENEIKKLYKSLISQTNKNFQWLIIDDGSIDNTKEVCQSFCDNNISINYYYKENGGKHTALNFSHNYIKGDLVCIVDSDDYLVDTAIDTILSFWKKYKNNDNVCGLTFLKQISDAKLASSKFYGEEIMSNSIDYRINKHIGGDCCEVIRTKCFLEFPFPVFDGEKFLSEGYLWNNCGYKYDTVYINKIIYFCDYLEDGLTKSGKSLRIKCPLGGMIVCSTFFRKENGRKVNFLTLTKKVWLYICYGKFANIGFKEMKKKCDNRKFLITINYLFGFILYLFYKKRYIK